MATGTLARRAHPLVWGAVAAVLASIVFAPWFTLGWCSDAAEGGTSVCGSVQQSPLGIETNVWVWLGALVVVAGVTWWAVRRRSRSEP